MAKKKEKVEAVEAKKESKDLKAEIKKMEAEKRKDVAPKADKMVSFDSWYHQRHHKIPKAHKKEILWADFSARGVKKQATMQDYDKALELYGVKLDS